MTTQMMPSKQNTHQTNILNKQYKPHKNNMDRGKQLRNTTIGASTASLFNVAILAFIVTTFKYIVETIYEFVLQKSTLVVIQYGHPSDQSTRDVKGLSH